MSSEATLLFPKTIAERQTSLDSTPKSNESAASDRMNSEFEATSDEGLMRVLAAGDKQALSLLFKRHARAVFHVAWRILRNEAEADDLRQDVFVYLYERAHLFDPGKGTAISWIMQITYHRAFDRRKSLVRRRGTEIDALDQERFASERDQPSSDRIDGNSILERLRGDLTPDQRDTLELHFFEGYSLREIADRKRQTLTSVRHHYYRAIERLRRNVFSKKRL